MSDSDEYMLKKKVNELFCSQHIPSFEMLGEICHIDDDRIKKYISSEYEFVFKHYLENKAKIIELVSLKEEAIEYLNLFQEVSVDTNTLSLNDYILYRYNNDEYIVDKLYNEDYEIKDTTINYLEGLVDNPHFHESGTIEKLVKMGANISTNDDYLLCKFIIFRHSTDSIKNLMEMGVNISARDNYPIVAAILNRYKQEFILMLVKAGATIPEKFLIWMKTMVKMRHSIRISRFKHIQPLITIDSQYLRYILIALSLDD